jgi:hydrogenase nickel incorporation protein HypA/HybF
MYIGATMHEMSIAQEIIDLCLGHAGGHRVTSLDVEIGNLSGVAPEAIEFCFEACSRETLLEGAVLNIIRVPGSGQCQGCGRQTPLTELYGSCGHCGSHLVTIVAGEELRVREIEVDD